MTTEEKIKSIRELKNFTQEFMAEKLGITQAAYRKIESGQKKLTMNKIVDIATIFEMDVNDLMAYDTQQYFNSFNNLEDSNIYSNVTKMEDETLKKLYEDKILLLEKLLFETEKQLDKYRKTYGDIYKKENQTFLLFLFNTNL